MAGDLTAEVRDACAGAGSADGFLLVTVRFWKNAFKYNSFCYHVVTQDAGALLGCWELIARATGRRLPRVLWFDDERLNRLLGLVTDEESVLAVVPLPFGPPGAGPQPSAAAGGTAGRGGPAGRPSFERSARTRTFEQVRQVHRAVLDDRRARPDPAVARRLVPLPRENGGEVELPRPWPAGSTRTWARSCAAGAPASARSWGPARSAWTSWRPCWPAPCRRRGTPPMRCRRTPA